MHCYTELYNLILSKLLFYLLLQLNIYRYDIFITLTISFVIILKYWGTLKSMEDIEILLSCNCTSGVL